MLKTKSILIFLVSLLLVSCESFYLNMGNVNCELDNTIYKKNEPITINYYGSFADSDDIGNLNIDFAVYNVDDDKKKLLDIQYPMPEDLYEYSDGEYYIKIREYERMTKFNDSIVFTIDEAGVYELYVNIDGYTEKRYYGGSLSFKFYITVTAGENYD